MVDHIDTDRARLQRFSRAERTGPLHLLNLARFRAQARYPDGRASTGAEAFAAYARLCQPFFVKYGVQILWRGVPELLLIGPDDERWDLAFINVYPSRAVFFALLKDPGYLAGPAPHRQAAIADYRILVCAPGPPGDLLL